MTTKAGHRLMVFLSKRMIACDEAGYLISLREDQSLGFRRWWQLKMHLLSCHLCRRYAHQIGQLNRSMRVYRDQCSHENCEHHLSSEACSRITKVVSSELNAK